MKRLALIFLLLIPLSTWSQVAFDAYSDTSASATDDFSFEHTPVGTPAYVIVGIYQAASGLDRVTSVTYGNVAMTEIAGPVLHTTSETAALYLYALASGIPTGAQSVEVDVSGTGAKMGVCITLTATKPVVVVDSDVTINSDSDDDPQVTLSLGGRTSFCMIIGFSGIPDPANITPFTNWTARDEWDFGAATALTYTYDIISTTDVTAGWTQTADDACMIALAVSEGGQGIIIVE